MFDKPLAFQMRPNTMDEVLGQTKIKSFLSNLIDNNALVSMVFYGPPGTGKTTLAKAFSNSCKCHSFSLNAVLDNKSRMEEVFQEAIRFFPSIVIIDEIHRMDKGKQDLLLPHLENGDFYLIGCTTANPLISLNPAIRSRTRLLETEPLSSDDILIALKRAIVSKKGLDNRRRFNYSALVYLSRISGGDLRFAYNQLEAISFSYPSSHEIDEEDVKSIVTIPNYLSDKDEDEHYNTVSAFQKSIRGSEIDAALYYLAKLLKSGDLEGTIRRLLVTAYEDIGLANPAAVDRCYHACEVAKDVGLPEAMIPLGFTVVELAGSPKSKSACLAIEKAMDTVSDKPLQVKDYLKFTRANVEDGYSYPYDDSKVWKYLEYLPDELNDIVFYEPEYTGKYEKAMAEYRKANEVKRTSNMMEAKRRAHLNEK